MIPRLFPVFLATGFMLLGISACAAFQFDTQKITPQQAAVIKATCAKIMRLEEGEAQFSGCVSSLSNSLAGEIQSDRTAAAYRPCMQTGLMQDSPELSTCVLDHQNAEQASNALVTGPVSHIDAANVKSVDYDPRSYFSSPFALRRRREQYACAEIALEPASGPFESCVANLDINLFNIDHPPS